MAFPALLFPAADRPSRTRRSSGQDEMDEGSEEGEEAKTGDEGKEEKTGEGEAELGDPRGDRSSKLLILWCAEKNQAKITSEQSAIVLKHQTRTAEGNLQAFLAFCAELASGVRAPSAGKTTLNEPSTCSDHGL